MLCVFELKSLTAIQFVPCGQRLRACPGTEVRACPGKEVRGEN